MAAPEKEGLTMAVDGSKGSASENHEIWHSEIKLNHVLTHQSDP